MKLRTFVVMLISGYVLFLIAQVYLSSAANHHILLWWTPFVAGSRTITCRNGCECLVTDNRNARTSEFLKATLFYGSNFDLTDAPLPKHNIWAIYHEESPKNLPIFRNEKFQSLFNITSTFSRFSSMPTTLQYLKDKEMILDKTYYVKVKQKNELLDRLAPILFIQSSCETPIQRDSYVEELMKYIKVDSYGLCLNNKPLPEQFRLNGTYDLYNYDFMNFVAQYKFVIAIENAKCYDYITEKFWRPIIAGSVPIYLGSPTIKDWLPNEKSAILLDDFTDMKSLAEYVNTVNNDDNLYKQYLEHKTKGKIGNQFLLKTLSKGLYGIKNNDEEYIGMRFECFVCEQIHKKQLEQPKQSVYKCEEPSKKGKNDMWTDFWKEDFQKGDEFYAHVKDF